MPDVRKRRFFGALDIAADVSDGEDDRTFVCDNLAFSSEIIISKRHTRFGCDGSREGIATAVGQLRDYHQLEAARIEQLQSRELSERTADSIVLRAWEQRLIGTRLLRPLLDEWRSPTYEEFQDRTAWSMLAALTHTVKNRQRRYPNRAAWEVMQFQAMLAA